MHTLEFDKICSILEEFCGSTPAKHMCATLRPSQSLEWIEKAQAQTAAAFNRMLKSDRLSFGANFDARQLLKDATIGRSLSME